MDLYFFGWPSEFGGAATRFYSTLHLLADHYRITVVPPAGACLKDEGWRSFLEKLGIRCVLWGRLPRRLSGWAVAFCQGKFFTGNMPAKVRARGLRLAWSNDMMWHFPLELGSFFFGLVDTLIYVSPAQRAALEPGYRRAVMAQGEPEGPDGIEGEIAGSSGRKTKWVVTGNYINPAWFPFKDRFAEQGTHTAGPLTIGRLSRPDPDKFPDAFPSFYEGLGLDHPKFRVMAWDRKMARRFQHHRFDGRWELLPTLTESPVHFLQSLDLFIYSVSDRFRESWGRAVVEAMLTGAVPLIPRGSGHHLERLIVHGESGFLCSNEDEYGHYARMLQDQPELRRRMSFQARSHAEKTLCNREEHLALWQRVFV